MDLRKLSGLTVVYVYPLTARPGVALPSGWDEIPGARGCTPESCAFRDHHDEFRKLGAKIYGLSAQSTEYQLEARNRLHLPFELLSDESFDFANALGLPSFTVASMRLLRRVTLVVKDGVIVRVFYPVFPPDKHPAEVISCLKGA